MNEKLYVGVFSDEAERVYGSVVWLDVNGEEILVTAVYSNVELARHYKWEDKQIVSTKLTKWVRDNKFKENSYIENTKIFVPHLPSSTDLNSII